MILRRLLDAGRLHQTRYTEYRAGAKSSRCRPERRAGTAAIATASRCTGSEGDVRTVLDAISSDHITVDRGSDHDRHNINNRSMQIDRHHKVR